MSLAIAAPGSIANAQFNFNDYFDRPDGLVGGATFTPPGGVPCVGTGIDAISNDGNNPWSANAGFPTSVPIVNKKMHFCFDFSDSNFRKIAVIKKPSPTMGCYAEINLTNSLVSSTQTFLKLEISLFDTAIDTGTPGRLTLQAQLGSGQITLAWILFNSAVVNTIPIGGSISLPTRLGLGYKGSGTSCTYFMGSLKGTSSIGSGHVVNGSLCGVDISNTAGNNVEADIDHFRAQAWQGNTNEIPSPAYVT